MNEVEIISGGKNIAPNGKATQSSVGAGGVASRAVDGNKSPDYKKVVKHIPMGLVRPIRGGKLIWVVNTRLMKWKFGIVRAMSPGLKDSLSNYWTPTGSRFTRVENQRFSTDQIYFEV